MHSITSSPVEKFLDRLSSIRQTGPRRWIARCPAHSDRHPSLSIRETSDGRILLHCFGGCSATEVVQAVGLELADLFPPGDRDRHYTPGRRPHIPACDVLRLVYHESSVVLAAAWTIARGGTLDASDLARVELAFDRLTDAMQIAGGAR